jgi:hypothetical protein
MPTLSTKELRQIEDQGYVVVDSGLDAQTLRELDGQLDTSGVGTRNLLDPSIVRQLVRSNAVRCLSQCWVHIASRFEGFSSTK